ncbi:hypothetical protein DRE_02809 [Drechslerella stenobrocha 248]|uniref:Elongator complex protein 4 n=1 Tax=Drechslerella stenobrocha 248 TaxID=1043628 RepID=W7I628_9PEZI|nr:hypothetical protein DRE_02809 [Drechslerella stenobrocha 248]
MSFRKRSVVLSTLDGANSVRGQSPATAPLKPLPKGVRPSFLTGIPTTSTGTASLDALLSGHAGLPLGSLLLLEESSTTDFAGALLRYYAAEGIIQGHEVVVIGPGEAWGRELPGLSERKDDNEDLKAKTKGQEERMKIAWRYEALGNRRALAAPLEPATAAQTPADLFCHAYDLTKRLAIPASSKPPVYIPTLPPPQPQPQSHHPLFHSILSTISTILASPPSSDATTPVTRIVIPNLLSPLLYSPSASLPTNILHFLHALRALTRRHAHRLTVMLSLPLALYPRSTGIVRQLERIADGVIELHPVPAFAERAEMRKGGTGSDEVPQGLVHVWKAVEGKRGTGIAIGGEGGGGGAGMEGGDDLAFMLTRRRMRIERFSLPVDDGDEDDAEAGKPGGGERKATKVDLEF